MVCNIIHLPDYLRQTPSSKVQLQHHHKALRSCVYGWIPPSSRPPDLSPILKEGVRERSIKMEGALNIYMGTYNLATQVKNNKIKKRSRMHGSETTEEKY